MKRNPSIQWHRFPFFFKFGYQINIWHEYEIIVCQSFSESCQFRKCVKIEKCPFARISLFSLFINFRSPFGTFNKTYFDAVEATRVKVPEIISADQRWSELKNSVLFQREPTLNQRYSALIFLALTYWVFSVDLLSDIITALILTHLDESIKLR